MTSIQLIACIGMVTGFFSLLICFKDGTEITQAMQRRISA